MGTVTLSRTGCWRFGWRGSIDRHCFHLRFDRFSPKCQKLLKFDSCVEIPLQSDPVVASFERIFQYGVKLRFQCQIGTFAVFCPVFLRLFGYVPPKRFLSIALASFGISVSLLPKTLWTPASSRAKPKRNHRAPQSHWMPG